MQTVKDFTLCTLVGVGLVSGAAIGIFGATLGMCAIALFGAG